MPKEDERYEITRRDFIKGTAFGTLGLALGLRSFAAPGTSETESVPFYAKDPKSQVVIVRNKSVINSDKKIDSAVLAEMLDSAVMTLSGEKDVKSSWQTYFKTSDIVGLKFTSCGWMRVPTHQEVIDIINKKLNDIGIPDTNIHVKDFNMPLEKCTALVNVPSIKVHSLTGIAVSIKNYINFDSGPLDKYHFDGSTKLAEIWLKPEVKGKTRLIVVDALTPYFGPGPQINPIYQWEYKGIIVGTDPVAVDTVCLRICQTKRNLFKGEEWPISPPPKSIVAADTDYHIGTSDPLKIKVIKLGWEEDALI